MIGAQKPQICSCTHSIYSILLGCFYFLLHYKPRISDQKQRNSVLICHSQDRERSRGINRGVHKKFQRIRGSAAEQTPGNDKAEHNYGGKKIFKIILGYSQLGNAADVQSRWLDGKISTLSEESVNNV